MKLPTTETEQRLTITEIAQGTTTFSMNGDKIHESIFRSYHALEATKRYLREGVPAKIVLELIAEMTPETPKMRDAEKTEKVMKNDTPL